MDIEREIKAIGMMAAHKLRWEKHGLYTLNHFKRGDIVEIDLIGERVDGVQITDNQTIVGKLTDPAKAIITVLGTLHPTGFEGEELGLATTTAIGTPVGIQVYGTLKGCIGAGRNMAYYLPEHATFSEYGIPNEYTEMHARYGRAIIDNILLFDYLPHSEQ